MGAIVAYEVTLELQRRHGPSSTCWWRRAPGPPTGANPATSTCSPTTRWSPISRVNASFGNLLAAPELLDLVLPTIRADYRLISGYARKSTCASPTSDFASEVECRSRYRATDIGLIAYT
jgi:pyochelin biosynthetic protein PchC